MRKARTERLSAFDAAMDCLIWELERRAYCAALDDVAALLSIRPVTADDLNTLKITRGEVQDA